jgi:eukaryotic-like serine/threonine-protein kinase
VWVADHLALGTQVAVKFMWRSFAEHPQFLARFRREAAAAAQLKNPHVAQVFDHGVTPDGEAFIVMELLEGEDLGKRLKRQGPLPPDLVAEILTQAAKALGKAHQSGIVHRDLKPDNIFLTDLDGELFVKILDFGIAKVQSEPGVAMTATGGTFGTPLYMSPEQLLSAKHVDHHADLWSLGAVAYCSLTKKHPFPGDTIGAISVAVHNGVFEPATAHRPDLPPELDAWFLRAFRRNPGERFGSARELADSFRAAVGARLTHPSMITGSGAPVPQSLDSSDSRQTLVKPPDKRGAHDTSPRTFDGKVVTIGVRRGKRAPVLAVGIGSVLLVGALAGVAVVRPWKRGEGDAMGSSGAMRGTTGGVTQEAAPEPAAGTTSTPVPTDSVPAASVAEPASSGAPGDAAASSGGTGIAATGTAAASATTGASVPVATGGATKAGATGGAANTGATAAPTAPPKTGTKSAKGSPTTSGGPVGGDPGF